MLRLSEFEAVIFDMDGVLIDSEPLWKIAMERAFHAVGCNLTRKDFQETVGMRIDEVVHFWYARVGWEGSSTQDVESAIVNNMVSLIGEQGVPLPGVCETLMFLKGKNQKIGLASSSYFILIETVLEKIELRSYFDTFHSAEHETHGKPHPAVYLTTAAQLEVPPSKCLVIEDSFNGIIAGKAAGMRVLCIPEKTHHHDSIPKLKSVADFFFDDMNHLLKQIEND